MSDSPFGDFDIKQYLDWFHVRYWGAGAPNVSPGWLGVQCLYCDDDHNHMGINLARLNFSCWKCKASGSLLMFIQHLEGIDYTKAWQRIREFQNPLVTVEQEERQHLVDRGQSVLPDGCQDTLTNTQRRYLEGRRFDPDALRQDWGLLSAPIMGPWRYRIILPVLFDGKPVTFIGMDPTGQRPPKYKAARVEDSFIPASELVYGTQHVRGGVALIVEGPTDAWRMGKGVVATLGMGVTPEKIQALLALDVQQFFICFDGEPLAIKNAHALGRSLSTAGRLVEVIELPSGDPCDLSDDDARHLRHQIGLL